MCSYARERVCALAYACVCARARALRFGCDVCVHCTVYDDGLERKGLVIRFTCACERVWGGVDQGPVG